MGKLDIWIRPPTHHAWEVKRRQNFWYAGWCWPSVDQRYNFYFDKISKFTFDVVVVDKKPKNISELNGNKGFAIWIDKSVLNDINREIYEFTFFTRKDVKSAETEDGKISITNCRNTGNKKWKINKEFYS